MGCCIIGVGGCGPLDPPCQLQGWLGLQVGRGQSPQPRCRKGNGSSCCQDTPGCQPVPGARPGLCPAPASCCQRSVGSPRACPDGLRALAATLGPFSRSHVSPTSRGTAEAQLPPRRPDATCQRDGHPRAGASFNVTPAAAEGQGCPGVNHCREQPGHRGREKLCRSQGCFPFISRIPQALKH